jgi:hypothetical protein
MLLVLLARRRRLGLVGVAARRALVPYRLPDLVWQPTGEDIPIDNLSSSIPDEPLPLDLWPPEDLVSLDEQNAYVEPAPDFLLPRHDTELGWWETPAGDFPAISRCPSEVPDLRCPPLIRVCTHPKSSITVRRLSMEPGRAMVVGDTCLPTASSIDPNTYRAACREDYAGHRHLHLWIKATLAAGRLLPGRCEESEDGGNPPVIDRAV